MMGRVGFEITLFVFFPFVAYAIFVTVMNYRSGETMNAWTPLHVSGLTLAGLAMGAIAVLFFGVDAPRGEGVYHPAHIENGQLIPGRLD